MFPTIIKDLLEFAIISGSLFQGRIAIAAAAGVFSHIQIINPAASARHLYVIAALSNLSVSTGLVQLRRHDVNLVTNGTEKYAKQIGSAIVPVGLIRSENNAALLGTLLAQHVPPTTVGDLFDWHKRETDYWRLAEGQGLAIVPDAANVGLGVVFTWVEVTL